MAHDRDPKPQAACFRFCCFRCESRFKRLTTPFNIPHQPSRVLDSIFCELDAPSARLVEFSLHSRMLQEDLARLATWESAFSLGSIQPCLRRTREHGASSLTLPGNAKPEQVIEALKQFDAVMGIKFAEAQHPGLIIDELHFPLMVLDERGSISTSLGRTR
jgi:hypothetical protein